MLWRRMSSPAGADGDNGLTLIENAPWGVVASVTPSTNPAATVINNAISLIAAGNSVIFAPHPAAKKVSQRAITTLLNQAIVAAGGPENLLVTVAIGYRNRAAFVQVSGHRPSGGDRRRSGA